MAAGRAGGAEVTLADKSVPRIYLADDHLEIAMPHGKLLIPSEDVLRIEFAQPVLTALWAFPITRVIDKLKVPPAKQLERIPRSWCGLADDLLGSVYAALVLHFIQWLAPGWFA